MVWFSVIRARNMPMTMVVSQPFQPARARSVAVSMTWLSVGVCTIPAEFALQQHLDVDVVYALVGRVIGGQIV